MLAFLRDNLAWMILSLIMSVTLWVVVTIRQNPDVTATLTGIPIEVLGAPKDLTWSADATTISAVLVGPSDVVTAIKQDKVRAVVDASKMTPGVTELPIVVTSSDNRARILSSVPGKVFVRVEKIETKDLPVKVNTTGSTPFGYNAGQARATPPNVTVTGPSSAMAQVTQVAVDVPLDEVRKSISDTFVAVPENSTGAKVDGVTISPAKILVELPVEQQLGYKTVPIAPEVVGNVAFGYQIVGLQVDPQTVTVVGDPKVLVDMTVLHTQPVSVEGATGDVALKAEPNLPRTVAFARAQDLLVRVLISPVTGTKSVLIAPQVQGLANGVTAVVSPPSVTVTITGPIPVLVQTQPADINVTIFATSVYSGTYTVHPVVKLPNLVSLVSMQPDSVSLEIK